MSVLLFLSSVEVVSLLKVTEDIETSPFGEVGVDTLALFIHTDGYDMQVMTVNVLVLHNDIRLVSIAHTLHILMCHFGQFLVRQPVIWMGIERNVNNWFLRAHLHWHVPLKVMQGLNNVNLARTIVEYLVGIKQLPLALVHLVGIILDGTEETGANRNLCYHRSFASFANATICCPCSIIWRVSPSKR